MLRRNQVFQVDLNCSLVWCEIFIPCLHPELIPQEGIPEFCVVGNTSGSQGNRAWVRLKICASVKVPGVTQGKRKASHPTGSLKKNQNKWQKWALPCTNFREMCKRGGGFLYLPPQKKNLFRSVLTFDFKPRDDVHAANLGGGRVFFLCCCEGASNKCRYNLEKGGKKFFILFVSFPLKTQSVTLAPFNLECWLEIAVSTIKAIFSVSFWRGPAPKVMFLC